LGTRRRAKKRLRAGGKYLTDGDIHCRRVYISTRFANAVIGCLPGRCGNEKDAPKPTVRLSWIERVKPTEAVWKRICNQCLTVRPDARRALGD